MAISFCRRLKYQCATAFLHRYTRVMSAEDPNPAATPTPCEDTQGDGRWMSLVCETTLILCLLLITWSLGFTMRQPICTG